MVPKYWLALIGERPETYFKSTNYTYSHDNSIIAVARSLVDGAAVHELGRQDRPVAELFAVQELFPVLESCLRYSVRTSHPQFLNQLYAGFSTVTGLREGNPVNMLGLEVGQDDRAAEGVTHGGQRRVGLDQLEPGQPQSTGQAVRRQGAQLALGGRHAHCGKPQQPFAPGRALAQRRQDPADGVVQASQVNATIMLKNSGILTRLGRTRISVRRRTSALDKGLSAMKFILS